MGHILDRSLEVCMVVVGLGSTGLGWGMYACPGLKCVGLWLCDRTSGVVGVVGVVPYVFALVRLSSAASRYIGMSG
jgi:hypothetical protein